MVRPLLLLLLMMTCLSPPSVALAKPLPSQLTGAIILKLMSLEEKTRAQDNLIIWVVNDPALAKLLEKRVGKSVGNGRLGAVYSDTLPANIKPDLVYINNTSKLTDTLKRANALGAISVSPFPDSVNQGVTVLVYDDQGLPSITINMPPSRQLKLQWDPSVLQISDVIY